MPAHKDSNHVHSYIRSHFTDDGLKVIWKCQDPFCSSTWTMPRRNKAALLGKASLCPECREHVFVLDSKLLKLKTPKCTHCRKGPVTAEKQATVDAAKNVMDSIFSMKPLDPSPVQIEESEEK